MKWWLGLARICKHMGGGTLLLVFVLQNHVLKQDTTEKWNESKAQVFSFPLGEGVRLASRDKTLKAHLKGFVFLKIKQKRSHGVLNVYQGCAKSSALDAIPCDRKSQRMQTPSSSLPLMCDTGGGRWGTARTELRGVSCCPSSQGLSDAEWIRQFHLPSVFLKSHQAQGIKSNHWQMGPHKTEKPLYSKWHHHLSETSVQRMGEIFPSYTPDRRAVSRTYEELKNTKYHENDNPIKTRGMELNSVPKRNAYGWEHFFF